MGKMLKQQLQYCPKDNNVFWMENAEEKTQTHPYTYTCIVNKSSIIEQMKKNPIYSVANTCL